MDKLWKAFERWVGKVIFNGSPRNMGSGSINKNDDGTPRVGDIVNDVWCVECKCYKAIGIFRWWAKLAKEAKSANKIPALVTREKGNAKDVLVTIHYSQFIAMKEAWEREQSRD